MIVASHLSPEYIKRNRNGTFRNGAYWYSREIVERIIPNVQTWRPWVTINVPRLCADHAIVFIHNNVSPNLYDWLRDFDDLILVCGVPSTCEKVKHLGRAVYLPLSIDVQEVQRHRRERKTIDTAFVGRPGKARGHLFPPGTVKLMNMDRELLLNLMAQSREVYAVGRCAIEAAALGCRVLPYDERFPDPSFWRVIDNIEAARLLQIQLDEIDKEKQ